MQHQHIISTQSEGSRQDDVQGHALSCQDAKALAALHLTTSLALFGLGDTKGGAYFAGQARGVLTGSC